MSMYYFALMKLSDESRRKLAKNLKGLLLASGLTETEFARLSGVAQKTINNICNPEGPSPNIRTLHKIAERLGLTVDELYLDGLLDDPQAVKRMRRIVGGLPYLTADQQESVARLVESFKKG